MYVQKPTSFPFLFTVYAEKKFASWAVSGHILYSTIYSKGIGKVEWFDRPQHEVYWSTESCFALPQQYQNVEEIK